MSRWGLPFVFATLLATRALAADNVLSPLGRYGRVEVAPAKTSIYVGSVSMSMPTLTRSHGGYETTYVAKVFPYFFSSENGRLRVEWPDDALRKLERGEVVEFTGRAVNEAGEERRVEGKATPANATSGKLKVRVQVSKRVELIFNTTYRFPDVRPAEGLAPSG